MRPRNAFLAVLAALSVTSVGLRFAATPATARESPSRTNIGALDFNGTDVRMALRQVFKAAGVSYTIASDVQGSVTLALRNVSFETALQNVLRQVEATYRVEGGVYEIVRRDAPQDGFGGGIGGPLDLAPFGGPGPRGAGGPVAIAVDGGFLYVVHGNTVTKIDKKSMKVVGQASLDGGRGPRGGLAP